MTTRDIEIFRLLACYRYLRSTYIHALVGGRSRKRLIERLGHLYHEGGYLDRPTQQWQAINARYMPVVYELAEAGARALDDGGAFPENGSSLAWKGRHREHRQFGHELMICDILASVELGTQVVPGLRFISSHEVLAKAPESMQSVREDEVERQLAITLSLFSFELWEMETLRVEVSGFKASWSQTRDDHIQAARLQLASIDDRLQRLTDALLDQLVDRDSYAERRETLLKQRAAQREKIEALSSGTRSPADDCEKFLELISGLRLSYEKGFPHEKRDLLKIVTSNFSVDRKNVAVELRNPFRTVVLYRKLPSGGLDRHEDRTFAKNPARTLLKYFIEEAGRTETQGTSRHGTVDVTSIMSKLVDDTRDADGGIPGKLAA